METASSLRKAAIVLAALGEDLAAQACSRLPASQILGLGEEIARLGWVSNEEFYEALSDFTTARSTATRLGGTDYARALLDSTVGAGASMGSFAEDDLDELAVFAQLAETPVGVLVRVLSAESPPVVAAVVSRLPPTLAGQLLGHSDDQVAADIAYRVVQMGVSSPGATQALARVLDTELAVGRTRREADRSISLQYAVDLIGALPAGRGKKVLESIIALDKPFGESLAEQVFTFEDIANLSDSDLQVLLRSADMNQLVLALKGTPEELRERIRANLSQRGRERLQEEMEVLGPVPIRQVQDAQRQICSDARGLADRGEITLEGGSDQLVE
jgi:flagellar motor switch protein FliG